jgi:hypothetical protein
MGRVLCNYWNSLKPILTQLKIKEFTKRKPISKPTVLFKEIEMLKLGSLFVAL